MEFVFDMGWLSLGYDREQCKVRMNTLTNIRVA
jgi:hypothetical protein